MNGWHRLWPYAVLLAALLPFVGKPYHIDDPVFLTVADQIRSEPAHPYAVRINWADREQPARDFMGSPPLHCYYLALVRSVGPDAEWWAHLWMLPFSLLGLYAVRRLAGGSPLATALWLSSPAVLVSATSLMPDIPVAALTALGAALFLERRFAGSGLVLLLAVWTRYNALAVLPALAFHAVARREWYGLAALLLPIAGVAAWFALCPASADTARALANTGRLLADRLVATPVFLAAASISPLSLAGIRLERRELGASLLVAAIAGIACATACGGSQEQPRLWLALLGALGVFALAGHLFRAVRIWRREREPLDLALWLWVAAALAIPVLYVHVAAKYLTVALAPLALLAVRASAIQRSLAWAGVAAWFVLACCLNAADYELAATYRSIAGSRSHAGVWIAAHWGLQWYGAPKGAKPLDCEHPPEVGDSVMLFRQAGRGVDPNSVQNRDGQKLESIAVQSRWPFRILSTEARAGWYAQHWGLFPYAFSTTPVERVEIWRILASDPATPPGSQSDDSP
jgi:hypothetical protein